MASVIPSDEQALLNAVTDRNLRLCLDNLRPAVEGLWRAGAPRIVQDFTDHGVEHYERIATYVGNLLSAKAPETKPLSSVEMFLLIAGIYLHDVGMQCDVTTDDGRQIKKRAEDLGADFGIIVFTATSASLYYLEEQKAIRKNHHYLSAAWIEYAYETGKSALGSAIKQIPAELIEDLMDVCLHHTTLLIENCGSSLRGGGAGRKRLVAALLRFADELDISSNRVDMTAVTAFAVAPDNSIFWWLHNLTEVTFIHPNVFRVTVRLRDIEFDEFAPLVNIFYLEKFYRKNKDTLQIMSDFGFLVVLDTFSGVRSLRLSTALPAEIKDLLYALAKATPISGIKKPLKNQGSQVNDRSLESMVVLEQPINSSVAEAPSPSRVLEAWNPINASINLAAAYYRQGKYPEAEAEYKRVLGTEHGKVYAYNGLGDVALGQGHLDKAEQNYRRALEIDPDSSCAHTGLGWVLFRRGRVDVAQQEFQIAVEIAPHDSNAQNGLGFFYYQAGKYKDAEQSLQKAIALTPNYFGSYNTLGEVYFSTGQFDAASKQYLRAIQLAPGHFYAYNGLGGVLLNLRRYNEAEKYFKLALERNPASAYAHDGLGRVYSQQGRNVDAEYHFKQALEFGDQSIRPEHPEESQLDTSEQQELN